MCAILGACASNPLVVPDLNQLPLVPDPTAAQVAQHHARYLAALASLFDAHKAKHGAAGETLEIW